MSDTALYAELKPDITAISQELFGLSEKFLRDRDNFLPHAAILTEEGEIKLVGATPQKTDGRATSTEVLPIVHGGLRKMAAATALTAIGVAENVTVTREGQKAVKAIKVLFEHRRGLAVALYLPFEKKLFRRYTFGEVFSVQANAEVKAWL
jgi:hypothetical protein